MSLGNEQIIVGAYLTTWNSVALGLYVGEEGVPTVYQIQRSKPLRSSDRWAGTKFDSIYQGKDYVFEGLLYEYLKGIAAFDPFGTAFGQLGTLAALKYTLAKPLTLTAVAGTPAATAGAPNTLTASKAILADEHQGKLQYGPDVRTVPLKMDLLPYDTNPPNGAYGHFTQT